ncbi:MAG: hypothetical protein RBG13Loki_0185 [Promethearchaeota archaeon CR_4]|nr:MAG: hypothetical protein RBG13Loki_0185 [Candidatus Lokiarchaeota archaeon CR_4]
MISLFQTLDAVVIDMMNYGRKFDQFVRDLLEESSRFTKVLLLDLQKGLYQNEKMIEFTKNVDNLILSPNARQHSAILSRQQDIFLELESRFEPLKEFEEGNGNYFECQVILEENIRFKKTRIFVILRGLTQKDPEIRFGHIIPPFTDLIANKFDRKVKILVKSKLTLPEIISVFENAIEIEHHKIQQLTPTQVTKLLE